LNKKFTLYDTKEATNMSVDHLTPESLRRLLERDNDEEQNRLLLHHLEVCPQCREIGGWIADLYRSGKIGLQFSSVDIDLGRSRVEAERLWEELRHLPMEEQAARVLDTDRFTTWGMAELLCRESLADPARAVELAQLATWISSRLAEWQPAEEGWLAELRALAWAHLGHAWKKRGEHLPAESAFAAADAWWEAGGKDMGDVLDYEERILELRR
jgi:hypothetical protein